MQGRRVDRKRKPSALIFTFFGWNAEELYLPLFGPNPQPSRTLCPSVFNSPLVRGSPLSFSPLQSPLASPTHPPFGQLTVPNVPHRVQPFLTQLPI